MMILRMIPNVVMHLPLTTYYGITFLSLYVGNTGIKSCTVKIGDKDIDFKVADSSDQSVLAVNGNPDETSTYTLRSENEKITLVLPEGVPAEVGKEEILLKHFLFYEVPWKEASSPE